MQKLIAKYALAAHLAIMAVAPLFLYPFLPPGKVATVLLWLSAIGAGWLLMEPSCIRGESIAEARERVRSVILRDPLFWFSIVVLLITGIRALNGGIDLVYDADFQSATASESAWRISAPRLAQLPGCVATSGYLPFATVVALTIVVQGAAHALGKSARLVFLELGSLFSGISALVVVIMVHSGSDSALAMVACDFIRPSFVGVAHGVWLVGSLTALFAAAELKWRVAEPFVAFGMVGNALGLVLLAPQAEVLLFLSVYVVVAVSAVPMLCRDVHGGVALRCVILAIGAVLAPLLLTFTEDAGTPVKLRMDAMAAMQPFADGYLRLRGTLSQIAIKAWSAAPWAGNGIGTFGWDIGFRADDMDWLIIRDGQSMAINGWWQLLSERGIIGAVAVVGFALLALFPWGMKLFRNQLAFAWRPVHILAPLLMLAVAVSAFFSASFLESSVMLAVVPLMALSGGSVPAAKADD